MTFDPDGYWSRLRQRTGLAPDRPDFRVDPAWYAETYPDVIEAGLTAVGHWKLHGRDEGRQGNRYAAMRARHPEIDRSLATLVTDRALSRAIAEGVPDAPELAFEAIRLGPPVDRDLSDFSADFYLRLYPDLAETDMAPFLHYLEHGYAEGRRSLATLRENDYAGAQAYDPDRPSCLIVSHDLTRSGAPAVALDLARTAARTHNVVVAALRGGLLLEAFCETATRVMITDNPREEFEYFPAGSVTQFDLAILNSVESFAFLAPCLLRGVPVATYLHEFTEYTRPAYKGLCMLLQADLLVFSSDVVRASWRALLEQTAVDPADQLVLPQRPLVTGATRPARRADARARLSEMLGVDCAERRIVYGAGHAQWRKGSDLFAMTAALAARRDPGALFVWIGDGENHEDMFFGVYYDKHLREVGANEPQGALFTLPAGDAYRELARAADAFYLPSRFDPLPNVVFDAAAAGCPVVLFEGATGFDDADYRDAGILTRVPFGDLQAAADALLAVAPGPADTAPPAPQENDPFTRISDALNARLTARTRFVTGPGTYDVGALFPPGALHAKARRTERTKIWSLGRRFVWKDRADTRAALAAAPEPAHRMMRIAPFDWPSDTDPVPDFAIHLHAYHTEDLAEDLARHIAYRRAARIVVTTDTRAKAGRIATAMAEAELTADIRLTANEGRDILPFLRIVAEGDDTTLWAHMHQKKSSGTSADGDVWRHFLLTILLGDDTRMSPAPQLLADPGTGLVGALDPYDVGWSGAARLLPQYRARLGLDLPARPVVFPVGNMFWTRAGVARDMLARFGEAFPWPGEPLPDDGTVYHLIERLWPTVAAEAGLAAVFLDKPDQPRS